MKPIQEIVFEARGRIIMDWIIKPFSELSGAEVYNILQARCEVFIVEQNCPYLDPDGALDTDAIHMFAHEKGKIAACCRINRPGTKYAETSIGRVITTPQYRRIGIGKELMRRAIDYIGNADIRISGQAYLQSFYESFGFNIVSEQYMEDDIPHYEMLRKA